MAPRAWFVIALASVFTAACDLKPKTPETRAAPVAATFVTAQAGSSASAASVSEPT